MLSLRALGVDVAINCEERSSRALLAAHYGRMRGRRDQARLTYRVARPNGSLVLSRDAGQSVGVARHPGELVLLLDQDLIIQIQQRRTDLYFIHAAVLEWAGRAVMLVAESGGGKSTTTWALMHHGFRYLSDELGPVDLRTLVVHPYARALTLKALPPSSYPAPSAAIVSARGVHIPAEALPGGVQITPIPLAAIFFLRYRPGMEPAVRRLTAAHATMRLYANALNPLAHPAEGLDGAIHIARKRACFELWAADLPATCALVMASLQEPAL